MEPFLGQIQSVGFSFAPVGWMQCNGDLISIAENSALFALLGTNFGGDGQTTFALPDLRGRVMVGQGQGPGLSPMIIGQTGGSEQVSITTLQMPAHNHSVSIAVSTSEGEEKTPTGKLAKKASTYNEEPSGNDVLLGVNQAVVGNANPVGMRNPYVGINHAIAIEGIFPSRN